MDIKQIENNPRLSQRVSELRALRAAYVRGGAELFRALWETENDTSLWLGSTEARTGFRTFDEFLLTTNIVGPTRYARFKKLLAYIGWERIHVLGVDDLKTVVSVFDAGPDVRSIRDPSKSAGEAIVDAAMASLESNGMPPSERHIKKLVRDHFIAPKRVRGVAKTPTPTARPRLVAVRKCATRVRELRALVEARDLEIVELRKEIAKRDRVIARLRGKGPSAREVK